MAWRLSLPPEMMAHHMTVKGMEAKAGKQGGKNLAALMGEKYRFSDKKIKLRILSTLADQGV